LIGVNYLDHLLDSRFIDSGTIMLDMRSEQRQNRDYTRRQ
jgi:hypothetical protein